MLACTMLKIDWLKNITLNHGSRIFSRGGGGFQKIFENFVDLFFRSTELIFRALPKHDLVPVSANFSAQQAKL